MSTTEPTSTPLSRDLDSLLKDVRDLRARVNATFQRIGNEPQSVQSVGVQIAIHREAIALVLETETSKNADDKRKNADDKREAVRRLLDACDDDVERLQLAKEAVDLSFHRAFGERIEVNGQQGIDRLQGQMRCALEVSLFGVVMGITQKRRGELDGLHASRLQHAHEATERVQEDLEKAPQPFFIDLARAVEAATPTFIETTNGIVESVGTEANTRRQLEWFATKYSVPAFANARVVSLLHRKAQDRLRTRLPVSTSTIVVSVYELAVRVCRWSTEVAPVLAGASLEDAVHRAVRHLASKGHKIARNERKPQTAKPKTTRKTAVK